LYINVSGGLGDQICAEPAIRYMKTKLYPDDELIIATHWPRIFKHLTKLGVTVYEQGKANLRDDTPYFIASSLPGPDTVNWMVVSHILCHTVDYTSIALMKRTLPLLDKTIKFEVDLQDYSNLFDLVDNEFIKDCIVIHPGMHWNTKTFPIKFWQEIIDKIATSHKVVIVGKSELGDPPDFVAGARGTVDVDCPYNAIDLREKLSLGMLGALFSTAKCLISNDSAPIHLAGAFDLNIVLIPSCKHPDHVLPYRNGTVHYKTYSPYKKLMLDDIESRPTQVYPTSAEIDNVKWNKYLPAVNQVVNYIGL
jgi:hypothetical protein